MGPWWIRQLAVFGSISPSTASGKVLFIRDDRGVELDHDAGRRSTTCSARGSGRCSMSRIGGLVAADRHLHDARRGRSSCCRSWSSAAGRGGARSTSGRSSSTRRSCSPSRRIVSAVHVPGGTFIHSAVALAPHAYILALEGDRGRRRLDRRPAAGAGTASAATRLFVGRRRRDRRPRRDPGRARRPRGLGREPRRPRRPSRRRSTSPARRPDDRLMSIDAAGFKYWTGRGGVVTPERPDRHDPRGRRAPTGRVARPRARRHPSPPSARSSPASPAAVDRRRRSSTIPGAGRRSPPTIALPGLLRARPDERCATRRHGRLDDPPRGARSPAALVFVVALRRPRRRRVASSSSRSPRTPPTTSASPGTCSRAAASSATRSGASRRRRSSFPRPAFEVWLPLPTFLAAIPMAILGPTFAAAQVSSVLVGSLVPVLAWRLAADVADERGLPLGRARDARVGAGLTAPSTCRSSSTRPCPTRRCRSRRSPWRPAC